MQAANDVLILAGVLLRRQPRSAARSYFPAGVTPCRSRILGRCRGPSPAGSLLIGKGIVVADCGRTSQNAEPNASVLPGGAISGPASPSSAPCPDRESSLTPRILRAQNITSVVDARVHACAGQAPSSSAQKRSPESVAAQREARPPAFRPRWSPRPPRTRAWQPVVEDLLQGGRGRRRELPGPGRGLRHPQRNGVVVQRRERGHLREAAAARQAADRKALNRAPAEARRARGLRRESSHGKALAKVAGTSIPSCGMEAAIVSGK